MAKTALLIFARSARLESVSKLLANDVKHTEGLFEFLNRRVAQLATHSNIPYFIYNETRQSGATFGERISNAVEDIFCKGFENVLILGNDCPQFGKKQLSHAIGQLESNDLVIGPDRRGGAYTIGISKKIFDRNHFSRLSWQTNLLAAELTNYHIPALLPVLADVNHKRDIKRIVISLRFRDLIRKTLLRFITVFRSFFTEHPRSEACDITYRLFGLAAPPCNM